VNFRLEKDVMRCWKCKQYFHLEEYVTHNCEPQDMMEINIDSPKYVRDAHRTTRAKWLEQSKQQDLKELKHFEFQKEYYHKKRNGLCTNRGCNNKSIPNKTYCEHHRQLQHQRWHTIYKYKRTKNDTTKKQKNSTNTKTTTTTN
jgi:hypothetical protein